MSTNSFAQKKAKSYIKLYKKHAGRNSWNWIAENISDERAIKFTVKYIQGGALGKNWTKIFTLEPGDFKHIGRHSSQHTTTVNTYISGARFISN